MHHISMFVVVTLIKEAHCNCKYIPQSNYFSFYVLALCPCSIFFRFSISTYLFHIVVMYRVYMNLHKLQADQNKKCALMQTRSTISIQIKYKIVCWAIRFQIVGNYRAYDGLHIKVGIGKWVKLEMARD